MRIPTLEYELYYNNVRVTSTTKRTGTKIRRLSNQEAIRTGYLTEENNIGEEVVLRKPIYTTTTKTTGKNNKIEVISITYNDYLSGSLDEIEIMVSDPTQKWIRNWKPEQEDTISGTVILGNLRLDIQEFYIDEISYSIYPNIITIKGLSGSIPKSGKLRKRRYDKYKETTLQKVVGGIAQRNNLILQWNGEDRTLLSLHSNGRSDLKILNDLAKANGFYCKVFTKVKKKKTGTEKTKYLIFQDLRSGELNVSWEGEQVSATSGSGQRYITITDADILESASFTIESTIEDRKDYRKYKPYDSKLEKFRSYNAKKQGYDRGTMRTRYSDGPIKDNALNDALNAFLEGTKGALLLYGNPDIVAGTVLYFDSKTSFNGTYLVWEVLHNVNYGSGWTTVIQSMKRLSDADLPKPPTYYSTPKRKAESERFEDGPMQGIYKPKGKMKKPSAIVQNDISNL